MSQIIRMTDSEFVLTRKGLVAFSSTFVVRTESSNFKDWITIPPGVFLEYDVEKVFKELGLNYLDYFGYTFGFNKAVDVYAVYDESAMTLKPVTNSTKYKDYTQFHLYAISDADKNPLEFAPITDWDKTKAVYQAPALNRPIQQKYVVTIVEDYSKHKLRAQYDDGENGLHWCSFPNECRTGKGKKWLCGHITWNGKNYVCHPPYTPLN